MAACSDDVKVTPTPDLGPGRDKPAPDNQSIFGPGGLSFGPGANKGAGKDLGEGAVLGVNAYLWRASLDTVSFMPITSADPFGGTIVTDWYTSPTAPGERYRLNVYILGRELQVRRRARQRVPPDPGQGRLGRCRAAQHHVERARGHHPDQGPPAAH